MKKIILWLVIILFVFFTACSNSGNTEIENYKMEKINIEQSEPGKQITCIQILERKMKTGDEHFKFIVIIKGKLLKKSKDHLQINVHEVVSKNLKKEKGRWIKNRSIVKKPPYSIGGTYKFTEKNEKTDNPVSIGYYTIYFAQPL